ncbi:MAG: hypothetical protein V1853_04610 [bacterium]
MTKKGYLIITAIGVIALISLIIVLATGSSEQSEKTAVLLNTNEVMNNPEANTNNSNNSADNSGENVADLEVENLLSDIISETTEELGIIEQDDDSQLINNDSQALLEVGLSYSDNDF